MVKTKKQKNIILENIKIIDTANKGKSVAKISNIRDEYLVDLLKLRKKYELKIRN